VCRRRSRWRGERHVRRRGRAARCPRNRLFERHRASRGAVPDRLIAMVRGDVRPGPRGHPRPRAPATSLTSHMVSSSGRHGPGGRRLSFASCSACFGDE
jgi:hypothetical protein